MTDTFKTLGNLIDNAVDVHHLSAPLYESLQHRTSDPRQKKLLEQMADNEMRMADLLKRMAGQVDAGVLDTRLQYTLEREPRAFIDTITPGAGELSLEQIGHLGEQLHGYLIDLLQGAQQKLPSTQGESLVRDIIQLEKADGRSFSRKANAVIDM